MRILLVFLLGVLGLDPCVIGQENVSGVYSGDFITSGNVFVITVKDTLVTGSFYFDPFEKLPFQGFYNRNVLKGFFFQNGLPVIMTGKLKNDSLALDVVSATDGSVTQHGLLARVSSNPNYNVSKIFAKEKPEHDRRLIGSWLIIKSVNDEGKDFVKEKYTEEFKANGFISISGPKFDKIFADPKASQVILPSLTWETRAGKIIVRSHVTNGTLPSEEFIHPYHFSGDTLIVANPKTKEYFLKKLK